jgi:hypothetical protein
MANLLGQNIGTNYKGILNLNTLNGNLTTTLEAITDGDGNASPLLLSTTLARVSSNLTIGGSTTASARLHVRGDGTNPIARFENSSGSNAWAITSGGTALTCEGQARIQGPAIANDSSVVLGSYNNLTTTSLTQTILNIQGNIVCAAGSGNKRISSIEYAINNSGAQTGTATGIFLNATETALNGMTHNLIDLQVGGASRFLVTNGGTLTITGNIQINGGVLTFSSLSRIQSNINGNVILYNNAQTDFGRLQFGGTTNSFPAIKRNAAQIDFRLADDSSYCSIEAGGDSKFRGTLRVLDTAGNNAMIMYGDGLSGTRTLWVNGSVGVGVLGNNASARLQVDSTTQGFLPPRMTTTQKNAITTPATGLVLYDSTLNKLCVYTGSAWETITSI